MMNFKLIFLMLFFEAFLYIAGVYRRGSSGGQSVGFITRRSGVQVSPSLLKILIRNFKFFRNSFSILNMCDENIGK